MFEIDAARPDLALVHLVKAGFAGALTGTYGTTEDVKAFIREDTRPGESRGRDHSLPRACELPRASGSCWTAALAAYLDTTESTHELARHLVDGLVATGRNPAVVSMITVMEILVRPLRATPRGHHTVLAFIRSQPNLTAVPVDLPIAQDAASLRAAQRFSPPDALIVGPGSRHQVGWLVTNDRAWAREAHGPRIEDPRLHTR